MKAWEAEEYKVSPYYILYKIIDVMYDKVLLGLNKFNLDLMEMEKQAFDKNYVDANFLKKVLTFVYIICIVGV